jgi:hypothetical protein
MLVDAADRIVLGGMLRVLPDDHEIAWAEKHLRVDPDIAWILGNFVEADAANDNGHIFPLDELKATASTLVHKPLNVLHQGRYVVGSFVANELIEPATEAAGDEPQQPILEALAAFWRGNFPEEYELVKRAHSEGAAFYSMECIPEEIVCAAEGCGLRAKYVGRASDTYCAHLADGRGAKRLIRPHFNAGAIIIPPVRPGWKRADINQLSQKDEQMMESVYAQLEHEMPHLDPKAWEWAMEQVMLEARDVSTKERKGLAKKGAALPDGSFPIANEQDLRNAIQAFGRAKDKGRAKAHIIKRARALGLTKLLPDGWQS